MSQNNSRRGATLKDMVLGGTLLIGGRVSVIGPFPMDPLRSHRLARQSQGEGLKG